MDAWEAFAGGYDLLTPDGVTRWADQHGAVVFRYPACASWPLGLWVLLLADGRLWAAPLTPAGALARRSGFYPTRRQWQHLVRDARRHAQEWQDVADALQWLGLAAADLPAR